MILFSIKSYKFIHNLHRGTDTGNTHFCTHIPILELLLPLHGLQVDSLEQYTAEAGAMLRLEAAEELLHQGVCFFLGLRFGRLPMPEPGA